MQIAIQCKLVVHPIRKDNIELTKAKITKIFFHKLLGFHYKN